MTPRRIFVLASLILWPLFIANSIFHHSSFGVLLLVSLFFVIGWYDILQTKSPILRDYPVVGHLRYILRAISPEIHQYFVESDTNGSPYNKEIINMINKRADDCDAFHPFGTEYDLYKDRYEWIAHAMFPKKVFSEPMRVKIGNEACRQPYEASLLNISAMSFGALGESAIRSLNLGAKIGGFYHNTGEGSLSPYHMQGGDIVLQIGTGNFGFRNDDGTLHEEAFRKKSSLPEVKMIEIKLSQGAKPGHGGLLPASKNSAEIAQIRMVKPHTDVFSPPLNPEFSDKKELVEFIQKVRELSLFKPVGIKLSIGEIREFEELVDEFKEQNIFPDFITVDAAEGGTGAAPIEYSNHIGMRGEDALKIVDATLKSKGVREKVKIIYSGKVYSGFTILKALCLGADLCNSARAFMFSLGCIQSLRCHTNTCPTGIATQNKILQKGVVPLHKSQRVANFHKNTIKSFLELLSTLGVDSIEELRQEHIHTQESLSAR